MSRGFPFKLIHPPYPPCTYSCDWILLLDDIETTNRCFQYFMPHSQLFSSRQRELSKLNYHRGNIYIYIYISPALELKYVCRCLIQVSQRALSTPSSKANFSLLSSEAFFSVQGCSITFPNFSNRWLIFHGEEAERGGSYRTPFRWREGRTRCRTSLSQQEIGIPIGQGRLRNRYGCRAKKAWK